MLHSVRLAGLRHWRRPAVATQASGAGFGSPAQARAKGKAGKGSNVTNRAPRQPAPSPEEMQQLYELFRAFDEQSQGNAELQGLSQAFDWEVSEGQDSLGDVEDVKVEDVIITSTRQPRAKRSPAAVTKRSSPAAPPPHEGRLLTSEVHAAARQLLGLLDDLPAGQPASGPAAAGPGEEGQEVEVESVDVRPPIGRSPGPGDVELLPALEQLADGSQAEEEEAAILRMLEGALSGGEGSGSSQGEQLSARARALLREAQLAQQAAMTAGAGRSSGARDGDDGNDASVAALRAFDAGMAAARDILAQADDEGASPGLAAQVASEVQQPPRRASPATADMVAASAAAPMPQEAPVPPASVAAAAAEPGVALSGDADTSAGLAAEMASLREERDALAARCEALQSELEQIQRVLEDSKDLAEVAARQPQEAQQSQQVAAAELASSLLGQVLGAEGLAAADKMHMSRTITDMLRLLLGP